LGRRKSCLNASEANVNAKDRGAESLNHPPAIRLSSGHLRDHCREPWTKTSPVFGRDQRLVHFSAARTFCAVQDKVGDVHFYFGQLDQLVRIVLFQLWKQHVPAAARSWENRLDIRRDAHLLAMPGMPELTAGAFLRRGATIFFAPRRIRRRRLAGIGGVRAKSRLKLFY